MRIALEVNENGVISFAWWVEMLGRRVDLDNLKNYTATCL